MFLSNWSKEQKLEASFIAIFSAVIVVLLYFLISLNGLVLGNDSAVHLAKAQIFFKTGQIPSGAVGWIPPLFEIMLAIVISLCGASNDVGLMVFLLKALAILANLLLFFSVYLVSKKFFNKKIAALSVIFMALCYPTYELNTWGGYTTVLGIAFLVLLSYYSYLAPKKFGYVVFSFFIVFVIVLNHQLTAFLAVVIMFPVMFLMLIQFKRKYLIGFVSIFLGGALAFFAYYFEPIVQYIDIIVYHVFFGNKAYVVQIPFTSFDYFLLYFGFIQFLAIGGIGISYFWFKKQKKIILFITLLLLLLVPFFFAQSHLFGLLLPFEWFTYYLTAPIAILASVFVFYLVEKITILFGTHRYKVQKNWIKIAAVALIVIVSLPVVGFHLNNTYGRLMLAAKHNSTSDLDAYDAGIWLNQQFPDESTVVVTQNPGDWFRVFSDKKVIAQTLDWVGRTPIADSVLNLDYEVQASQTMVKAYEINSYLNDEKYVSINLIWQRVIFSSIGDDFVSFDQNGVNYNYALSDLNRTVSFSNQNNPKITFRYFNNQVELTKTIIVQNDTYPIYVAWDISPLNADIFNASLYLTTFFDLNFHFDSVNVPQLMNWVNPWDSPSKTVNGEQWTTVEFNRSNLIDPYLGVYDQQNQTAVAFHFTDLPDWGNIGALANHEIDAVRYQYTFNQISFNQTVTRQYQILALTKNSYPTLQPDDLQNFFHTKTKQFPIAIHNYKDYIEQNNIRFLVYDKNQTEAFGSYPLSYRFLPQIHKCLFLELVYSNSKYEVFKILGNYNQTHVWT